VHPSSFVAPSASLVIRGSVKLACAITASDLAQVDIHTWLELRSQLQKHHKARIEQYRFRRDPKAYLANLESGFL
jgi:hypothetical protein